MDFVIVLITLYILPVDISFQILICNFFLNISKGLRAEMSGNPTGIAALMEGMRGGGRVLDRIGGKGARAEVSEGLGAEMSGKLPTGIVALMKGMCGGGRALDRIGEKGARAEAVIIPKAGPMVVVIIMIGDLGVAAGGGCAVAEAWNMIVTTIADVSETMEGIEYQEKEATKATSPERATVVPDTTVDRAALPLDAVVAHGDPAAGSGLTTAGTGVNLVKDGSAVSRERRAGANLVTDWTQVRLERRTQVAIVLAQTRVQALAPLPAAVQTARRDEAGAMKKEKLAPSRGERAMKMVTAL